MRFRTLWNCPSFGGYLAGHSFWRTCAYGLAADMGRSINDPKQVRAEDERVCRNLEIKMNLINAGILPGPGETKSSAAPRRAAYVAAVCKSLPTPTVPPDMAWRPKRKPAARFSASRPPMIKPSGGLRGSTATKWR